MDIKHRFGKRIKELRLKKGVSQEKLAEQANLHRTYMSAVELGKRNVSLMNIDKIARALGCKIKDLF